MRGRARRRGVPIVLLALALAASIGSPLSASARETVPCASIRLDPGARVSGEELGSCLRFRMDYASAYRTRIAATGDTTTVADAVLHPLEIRARRGGERVVVHSTVRSGDSLFATFVRHAVPPPQLVAAARSVPWWTVVRETRVGDADGRSRAAFRLEPVQSIRFDDTTATSVSLHVGDDFLPVRFRATTTAVGIAVTYTQRWSDWAARAYIVCDDCRSAG